MSALELGAAVGPFGEISGAVAEVLSGMPAALDRHAADIRAIRIERCYAEGLAVAALAAAAPLIEAQVRESIAAEFDAIAALLTEAMKYNPVGYPTYELLRDRRAQMATAAQMVRGGVTP